MGRELLAKETKRPPHMRFNRLHGDVQDSGNLSVGQAVLPAQLEYVSAPLREIIDSLVDD